MATKYSVQTINLSKEKKKNMNNTRNNFYKLPISLITYIQGYLTINEHKEIILVHSMFQKSFQSLYSINSIDIKNSIKYVTYLFQLERLSKENFSKYLNHFMSINIISFPPKQLSDISLKEQSKILSAFLTYRYELTLNKSFMINITSFEVYNLYFSVISQLTFRSELNIKLNLTWTISQPINDLIPLFTIITPKKLKKKTSMIYSQIQCEIFKQKIEAYHYYIYYETSDNLNKADEYFNKYPNHLYSINSSETSHFATNNQLSIKTIIGGYSYDLSESCQTLKLRKIKFQYAEDLFKRNMIINDFSEIETFGGFQAVDEDECEEWLDIINNIPKLKALSMIEIGEDTDSHGLFEYFFTRISANNKTKIEKIKMWFYTFKKGKDYEFLMNNFPSLRVVTEDYDASGLYDERFEINKIFSCNASEELDQNDLDFLVMLLENNMKKKCQGKKYFKMNLFNNITICNQLIQHLYKNNETILLNSIHSINNDIDYCDNKIIDPFVGIKQMNYFSITEENTQLISLLKNVECIIEIRILKKQYFDDYYEFIKSKHPICIVYLEPLFTDLISKLENISSIKYLIIAESQIPLFESQYYKDSLKIKVLSKLVINNQIRK